MELDLLNRVVPPMAMQQARDHNTVMPQMHMTVRQIMVMLNMVI
jgi:hypothetical protein